MRGMDASVRYAAASRDLVYSLLDDQAVILHLRSGKYYGLEGVGSRAWELLQEPRDVHELVGALVGEYDVEPARCQEDLLALLRDLSGEGLIEPVGLGAA